MPPASPTTARLEGTLTALYTPFGDDGRVDLDAYAALAERLAAAGSGLVACGTTGETPTLTRDEYARCIEVAVAVGKGRVPVVAGTGQSSTAEAIATTALAQRLGADSALVVVPPYNKPPQRGMLAHFRAVAEVGLPVILYNVPGRTGANLLPATALELARDPRFVAIKEAGGSLPQAEALIRGAEALGNGFSVLSGDDALTVAMMALGAHGVVSVAANVVPVAVTAMVEAALRGDLKTAYSHHDRLVPLFEALFASSNPIPVKAAAALLGHARDEVRLPLLPLDATCPVERRILDRLAEALSIALELERSRPSASTGPALPPYPTATFRGPLAPSNRQVMI